jgi:hypothetical protein
MGRELGQVHISRKIDKLKLDSVSNCPTVIVVHGVPVERLGDLLPSFLVGSSYYSHISWAFWRLISLGGEMALSKQVNIWTRQLITAFNVFVLVAQLLLIADCGTTYAGETGDGNATRELHVKNNSGKLIPLNDLPANAKRVTVGIYTINIYDLDLRSNTYRMSAYVWLIWKGDFDPVESLEFTNVVENSGFTKQSLLEAPRLLKNGSKYQAMHIEGRFFQPYDLKKYPLDSQELSLFVENTRDTYNEVVYIPDHTATGYDSNLLIPGWKVTGLNARTYIHDYGTNFGEADVAEASKYSTVKFSFDLVRNIHFFMWKLLLPLLIVLLTNWFALILKPTLIEVRTAMPATALLTAVFMRQSAMDAIPECPSLVLMDQIYLLAYLFILLTLLQVIWINTQIVRRTPENIARIIKIDKMSFAAQITGFSFLLCLLLWWM